MFCEWLGSHQSTFIHSPTSTNFSINHYDSDRFDHYWGPLPSSVSADDDNIYGFWSRPLDLEDWWVTLEQDWTSSDVSYQNLHLTNDSCEPFYDFASSYHNDFKLYFNGGNGIYFKDSYWDHRPPYENFNPQTKGDSFDWDHFINRGACYDLSVSSDSSRRHIFDGTWSELSGNSDGVGLVCSAQLDEEGASCTRESCCTGSSGEDLCVPQAWNYPIGGVGNYGWYTDVNGGINGNDDVGNILNIANSYPRFWFPAHDDPWYDIEGNPTATSPFKGRTTGYSGEGFGGDSYYSDSPIKSIDHME